MRGALPRIPMKSHWQADRVGNIIKGLFIFHISCFAFAAYSLLLCSILPPAIHFPAFSLSFLFQSPLASPPPPPPSHSSTSHPPNICVKSLSMPQPGSVGHIRTRFPLFFSQKKKSRAARRDDQKTRCFLLFWPRYAFPLCRHPGRPLMMPCSRRWHKHAASPAEHLGSYKSTSARGMGIGGHIKTSDWSKILNISNEEFQSSSWPLLTSPGITWPDQLGEKSSYHKSFVFHPMRRWISSADAKKLKFPSFPAWLLFDYTCKIHRSLVSALLIASFFHTPMASEWLSLCFFFQRER